MDMSSYLAYLSYQLQSWATDCGISHEMNRLRVALLRTQSILHGAEVTPSLSYRSLPWMRELRDVMHDAENLLDKLEYNRRHHQMQESSSTESNSSPISTLCIPGFATKGPELLV
uniref:Disease resistance N-terminal domain-containing protein n=1 Tax=Oryza punctata TaxID=4537 RepID=A0A0E0KFM8_ORYPU